MSTPLPDYSYVRTFRIAVAQASQARGAQAATLLAAIEAASTLADLRTAVAASVSDLADSQAAVAIADAGGLRIGKP